MSARRLLWHGVAGFGMGAACTIATVPFTTGTSTHDANIAIAMLLCSTLLSIAIALASAIVVNDTSAVVMNACLAPFAGGLNAIATYALSQWLDGADPTGDLMLVAVFAVPYGGIPGLLYAVPLLLAACAARRALALPAGTSGAGARLLLWIAVVSVGTAAFARLDGRPYAMWEPIRAFLVVLVVLCASVAARDLWTARRLSRARDLEVRPPHPVDRLEGVARVASAFGPAVLDTVLWAPSGTLGDGPYRVSPSSLPHLVLAGPPDVAARRLRVGAVLLLSFAAALAAFA